MKKKSNNYLKRLIPYALPYKKYAYLNVISNVFYALFSTLAMLSLMPMINVLFGESEKIYSKPIYNELSLRGTKCFGFAQKT